MLFSKSHTVPKGLQQVLLISVLVLYSLQAAYMTIIMAQQASTNPNFSGFMPIVLGNILLPLIMAVLAFYLNPRKLLPLERLFESVLITIVGLATVGIFTQLYSMVGFYGVGGENFLLYEFVVNATAAVLFGGALYYLRRTKRWK